MKLTRKLLDKLITEVRMARTVGSFSPMASRADPEFAKLIKGDDFQVSQSYLESIIQEELTDILAESDSDDEEVDEEMDEVTEERSRQAQKDLIELGYTPLHVLLLLIEEVYIVNSSYHQKMLDMMGHSREQIEGYLAGELVDIHGDNVTTATVLADEIQGLSDVDSDTFLSEWLGSLSALEAADDMITAGMAAQRDALHAEKESEAARSDLADYETGYSNVLSFPTSAPSVLMDRISDYLEMHGLDQDDEWRFEGDNVSEQTHIVATTLDIGDQIADILDPTYDKRDNPFRGQNDIDVNHHRLAVTWSHEPQL